MEATRKLTRFLQVTVQEQAAAGQPGEALQTGNDLLAMGVGLERGTIIWALHGLACEDAATRTMGEPAERVPAAVARNAALRLSELDRRGPAFSEVQAAEDYYWPKPRVLFLPGDNPFRQLAQGAEIDHRGAVARRRALLAKLAVCAYRAGHQAPLADLKALVPGYLDAVPEDPFTGGPLRYRKTTSGFVVYSVGPDKVDDGGQPLPYGRNLSASRGDICAGVPAGAYWPRRATPTSSGGRKANSP
jgi:hypothetical protein